MAQGYITQEKDYWIHSNALSITLNALGNANRIQCSVSSGAVIMAFIDGNTTLGYNAAHNYKSWPLSASPTYFNSDTAKYVYVAIPRTDAIGTQAVVVFPSEKLDIYGKNAADEQVGSTDYLYIFLGGIISDTNSIRPRTWTQAVKTGKLDTDQGRDEERQETEWYQWSTVMQTVTFLKRIVMAADSWFQNIRLGSDKHELTGVATGSTGEEYIDSEALVVTPSYVEANSLSKKHDDVAEGNIEFEKDITVDQNADIKGAANIGGDASVGGNLGVKGWIKALRGYFSSIQSDNYTGDGIADTGYLLTSDHNGNSKLIVDELYVRIKAVFEELQVKREKVTGGNQVFSCAANVINRTDYYNRTGGTDTLLGYTEIKMPWLLRRMPTFLRRATLGVFSTKRNIRVKLDDTSNITFIRCYFLAKEGEQDINNLWAVNDLARCQTFNLNHKQRQTYVEGTETQVGNVFWWRKVTGISSTPVEIDGRLYHYFDVSMSDCAANSDLPAAGDEVSQWGNTTDTSRMNLRTIEVNGANAPADKWYRGIYTFDMNKCWWGGNPRKDMISAADGVEFYGPTFKYVQEYGVERVVTDRGAWSDITTTRDDYNTHGNVRKCYYYDRVSHNGSLWLCSITDGVHWVDGSGNYITDAAYAAFTEEQKALCSRKQNYTTQEPSESATDWTKQVSKGDTGSSVWIADLDNEMDSIALNASGSVVTQQTIATNLSLNYGATAQSFKISGIKRNSTTVERSNSISNMMFIIDGQLFNSLPSSAATAHSLTVYYYPDASINGKDNIEITLTDADGGNSKVLHLTVNGVRPGADGDNAVLYSLNPSASEIVKKKNGSTEPSTNITCSVIKTDGDSRSTASTGFVLKTIVDGTEQQSSTVNPVNVNTGITYELYVPDVNGTLVDRETIPVVTDGIDGTDGRDGTDGHDGTDGRDGTDGHDGQNGKDGWMITANPANVILTQNMVTTSTFTTSTVSFTAKKGSVNATISSIGTPSSSEFNVAKKGNSGDDAKKVVVSSPKTYTPSGSSSTEYYTEGSFIVQVNVTDPDTNTTVVFDVVVPCYANLLGKWTQTIEDGVETSVATKLGFVDPSTGVYSIQYAGTYIRGWAENTSILTQKVNNGKNLLSGVLTGAGWKSAKWGTRSYIFTDDDVELDANGWMVRKEGYDYIASPEFTLESGKKYTLSFEAEGTSDINAFLVFTFLEIPIERTSSGTALRTYKIESVSAGTYRALIQADKIVHPQVELGESATAFDAGDTEVSSSIKQTADSIILSVNQKLEDDYATKSELQITADSINMTVESIGGKGKNILLGTSGYTSSSEALTHTSKEVDGYIEYRPDADGAKIYSAYELIAGKTYVLQCQSDGTLADSHDSSTQQGKYTVWLRYFGDYSGSHASNFCFTSQNLGGTTAGGAKWWLFTPNVTGTYYFRTNTYSNGSTDVTVHFWNIMLEMGTAPSAWEAPRNDTTSSLIRQTAGEIVAEVEETGVDVTNGKIDLYADKVRFFKNKAHATSGDTAKIWIDGSDGSLHAVDGDFSGIVRASAIYQKYQSPQPEETIDPSLGSAILIPSGYIGENIYLPSAADNNYLTLVFYRYFDFNEISTITRISASGNDNIYTYTKFSAQSAPFYRKYCKSFYPPNNVVIKIHAINGRWCLDCDETMLLDEQYPILTFYDENGNQLTRA